MVSVKPVLFELEDKKWHQNGDADPDPNAYYLIVTPEVTVWHHRRQWERAVYNIIGGRQAVERYMPDVDGLETMCICQELLRCPEKWKDLPAAGSS